MSDLTPRKALYDIAIADLEREIRSSEALGTRATGLLGFCGVVLALTATVARDPLVRDLGAVGRPVAAVALVASLAVILMAALLTASMLTPKQRGRTKPEVLRELRRATDPEGQIFDRLCKSAITLAAQEGRKNDQRGRRLGWAYLSLTIGLALLTGPAVILAASTIGETCTIQTRKLTTTQTLRRATPTRPRTTRVKTTSYMACAKGTSTKRADRP